MKIGNIDRARHEDLLPSERARELDVMIVGCGAIGSWTAVLLAKMGVRKFTLVDFDKVEDVNVSVQAFGALAIGDTKPRALKAALMRDSELKTEEVVTYEGPFVKEMVRELDVCIASMDNLKGRQEVWRGMRDHAGLFIDPRMGAQFLEIHAVARGETKERAAYEKVIWSKDEEFTPEPCAAKAIAYTGAMAGAQVANAVRQWAAGEKERVKVFMFDIVKGEAWSTDPGEGEDRLVGESGVCSTCGGLRKLRPPYSEGDIERNHACPDCNTPTSVPTRDGGTCPHGTNIRRGCSDCGTAAPDPYTGPVRVRQ